MHPSIQHVLHFFRYDHLPPHLQEVSRPFSDMAHNIANKSNNIETTVALRKLLESKDAAVRAVVMQRKDDAAWQKELDK